MQEVSSSLVRLNFVTRQWHAAVDEGWLDLMRPSVSVPEYRNQLVRTYGLVAPFESACRYTPGLARLVDYGQLNRAGLIAHDLLALNLSPTQLANVPIDQVVSDVKRVRDGNDRSRPGGALDRRGHAPSLELAFASPAADIGHVIAVAAHRLAAFLSRLARLRA